MSRKPAQPAQLILLPAGPVPRGAGPVLIPARREAWPAEGKEVPAGGEALPGPAPAGRASRDSRQCFPDPLPSPPLPSAGAPRQRSPVGASPYRVVMHRVLDHPAGREFAVAVAEDDVAAAVDVARGSPCSRPLARRAGWCRSRRSRAGGGSRGGSTASRPCSPKATNCRRRSRARPLRSAGSSRRGCGSGRRAGPADHGPVAISRLST